MDHLLMGYSRNPFEAATRLEQFLSDVNGLVQIRQLWSNSVVQIRQL